MPETAKKKKFQVPTALTIVFLVLMFVAVLTWLVPTSVVVTDDDGNREIVYNAEFDSEGEVIENAGTSPKGLWDLFLAPIEGFADASGVIITILVSGGTLAVLNYVGALDAGIGLMLRKFSGSALICILMLTFALMGTVYGSWEELPAYALIIIPLFCAAGYDVITGIAVVLVGATIGNMASVVNPFSTGSAIAAIGNEDLSLGSGIALRLVLFVVFYAIGTFSVLRYAKKVKADKAASVVHDVPDINTLTDADKTELPELTRRRKWTLIVFLLVVLATVIGYIPWYAIEIGGGRTMYDIVNAPQVFLADVPFIGNFLGVHTFSWWGDWYFDEFSWVFLVGAIIIAIINKMDERQFAKVFVDGCKDLMGVCVVLAVSRGISILMGTRTEGMSITFVYWIQNLLAGIPVWAFAVGGVLVYIGIGFFLQSTSGVAGITMPILGAVAMALFAGSAVGEVGGQIVLISAFTMGVNFTSSIYPGATVIGINELSNVPYSKYLGFMLRIVIPMVAAGVIILSIAPYIGLLR